MAPSVADQVMLKDAGCIKTFSADEINEIEKLKHLEDDFIKKSKVHNGYQCGWCRRVLQNGPGLIRHRTYCTWNPVLKQTDPDDSEIKSRKLDKSGSDVTLQCVWCNRFFTNERGVIRHKTYCAWHPQRLKVLKEQRKRRRLEKEVCRRNREAKNARLYRQAAQKLSIDISPDQGENIENRENIELENGKTENTNKKDSKIIDLCENTDEKIEKNPTQVSRRLASSEEIYIQNDDSNDEYIDVESLPDSPTIVESLPDSPNIQPTSPKSDSENYIHHSISNILEKSEPTRTKSANEYSDTNLKSPDSWGKTRRPTETPDSGRKALRPMAKSPSNTAALTSPVTGSIISPIRLPRVSKNFPNCKSSTRNKQKSVFTFDSSILKRPSVYSTKVRVKKMRTHNSNSTILSPNHIGVPNAKISMLEVAEPVVRVPVIASLDNNCTCGCQLIRWSVVHDPNKKIEYPPGYDPQPI
jgi:hypothetical protein